MRGTLRRAYTRVHEAITDWVVASRAGMFGGEERASTWKQDRLCMNRPESNTSRLTLPSLTFCSDNCLRIDLIPVPSRILQKFETADDIDRFQVTTDKVLGGKTNSSFSLKKYSAFSSGECMGLLWWLFVWNSAARSSVRHQSAFGDTGVVRARTWARWYAAY